MGVKLVRTSNAPRFQVKSENSKWSKSLKLGGSLDRINNFITQSEATKGRFGYQKEGKGAIDWSDPIALATLKERVHDRLPDIPLGDVIHIDRDSDAEAGPDTMLAKASLDPGKIPPLKTWASFGGSAAAVCNYAKRARHFITIQVNGHDAKGQPATVYSFREVAYELRTKFGIVIYSVSGQRSCSYQCDVCKSICGNCGGCPGRCGEPGHSTHQPGLAEDFHIAQHPGMSYPDAYDHCKRVFMDHGWENFTDWNPSGTDPNHASYKCKG